MGAVVDAITDIPNLATFLAVCRKRSVFTDKELREHWDFTPRNRPFVVNFLFVYSLPKRPNLKRLTDIGVITNEAPRGFELISDQSFNKLLEVSNADPRFIVR